MRSPASPWRSPTAAALSDAIKHASECADLADRLAVANPKRVDIRLKALRAATPNSQSFARPRAAETNAAIELFAANTAAYRPDQHKLEQRRRRVLAM